ncbi:MAG: hypothetical protein RIS94_2375 [Pseudomonadota bacterium]|jgi:UrcA family protein
MTAKTIAFAAFATLGLLGQPAFATEYAQVSKEVRYGDLDLTTPHGQAALDARLRRAASDVCSNGPGPHPLSDEVSARRCYKQALQNARQTYAAAVTRNALSR